MSLTLKLPGLIVPPLTPFNTNLQVDYHSLQKGVDYVVNDCNASMVIATGVEAQEYHYLKLEERKELIKKTIEFVDKRVPVAVGISHPSYQIAVELAHFAQDLGAQAVQLLAPLRAFGGEPSHQETLDYFQMVLNEIKVPLVLYLNSGPGANVSIPTTIALSQLKGIDYIKESSRDLSRVSRLIAEIELAGHARYFTTMQMLLITLQLGGSGITLPPPAAYLANKVINAFTKGDMKEASRLQLQFASYPNRWMGYGLTPTMKASLKLMGLSAGDPYPPHKPISGDDLSSLESYLKTTDFPMKK
ncbi:MAG: dihydrodipicolinate synthase family protein [Betaproteobacteria bacterium]